jgi:hypothetical protein
MQICREGSLVHVPEPLVEYRKHPSQLTSQVRHGYRVVAALWEWVSEHPDALSAAETSLLRRLFAEEVVVRHDHAFWRGDGEIVEKARGLYRELMPEAGVLPPLFERESPSCIMRVAYGGWNALLDALPGGLRRGLVSVSRGAVERVKRGRRAGGGRAAKASTTEGDRRCTCQ